MIVDEITYQIESFIGFSPTNDQHNAALSFAHFLTEGAQNSIMIIKGSAGTGKTSLASAIVKTLTSLKQKVVLMAPTGRAAKVFSINSGATAFTIHRKIYRQKTFAGLDTTFNLNDNLHKDTLFIVDEASMISNSSSFTSTFGSGCLLEDLLSYVYNGVNCRLLLIGDNAQLPPIGEEASPALTKEVLERFSLEVYESELNEVLRQNKNSGILWNANIIRTMIDELAYGEPPIMKLKQFSDIEVVYGDELIECLNNSYKQVGVDETMVITRSNARAKIYNLGTRNKVFDYEEELNSGDILMVVKNNYYWTEQAKAPISFLANGDRAIVRRVRNKRELYGLHFADVLLQFPDYDNYELYTTIILDTLLSDTVALSKEQNELLYKGLLEDYQDVSVKTEKMKQIRSDAYFNALQVKYSYAITCHKAQGGQWAHVYIDQGFLTEDMLNQDYYHWLYTALTRASEKVYLVNWNKKYTDLPED